MAALLVAALLITGASSYADWRLFGDYDKKVAVGVALLAFIVLTGLMPTARRR